MTHGMTEIGNKEQHQAQEAEFHQAQNELITEDDNHVMLTCPKEIEFHQAQNELITEDDNHLMLTCPKVVF